MGKGDEKKIQHEHNLLCFKIGIFGEKNVKNLDFFQ